MRGAAPRGALENRDLLPDLSGETGRQSLDLVHAGENDAVVEPLHQQGGDLADEREQLTAEIEILRQIDPRRRLRMLARARTGGRHQSLRVLGELMHVDDMREAAQLMQ